MDQLARSTQKQLSNDLKLIYSKLRQGYQFQQLENRPLGIKFEFKLLPSRLSLYWIKLSKFDNIRSCKFDLRNIDYHQFRILLNELIFDLLYHPRLTKNQFHTYIYQLLSSDHIIRRGNEEFIIKNIDGTCTFRISCSSNNIVQTKKFLHGMLVALLPKYCKKHLKEILQKNQLYLTRFNYYPM